MSRFPMLIGSPLFSSTPDPTMRQTVSAGGSPFPSADADKPDRPAAPVLLTIPEVAVRLNVSEKTVRRRIKDGTIRVARIGGRLQRISPDELARLAAGEPEKPL